MNHRSLLLCTGLGALLVTACGGGAAVGGGGSGSSGSSMVIVESSNGFGKLLPHRIPRKDASGLPTANIVEITRMSDLADNVTLTNPVLPPIEWPTTAVLPNGDAGNHFVYVVFSRAIGVDSVLEGAQSASVDNNLTGNIQIVQVNPISGQTIPIAGRAFINGMTYGSQDQDTPSQLLLEPWVQLDGNGKPIAADPRGLGFPGTESVTGFAGANQLVNPNTFVFVVDSDGDLTTHEKFPSGVQIQMRITRGVTSIGGRSLREEGLASSTVGTDTIPPEVLIAGASQAPVIIPGNGELNVDPETTVEVTFTEPVQVLTVGSLNDGSPPALSAAIQLQFGPSTSKVSVPFFAEPLSVFDMSRVRLTPLYNFPGSGPSLPGDISCGTFSQVDVVVNAPQFDDLCGLKNTQSLSTSFTTGQGPGLVNAPVVPDAIYVGRGGSQQAISVIDLNGFGQGCGNPTYDNGNPITEGNTNFPNNPNVRLQGSLMVPPLSQGSCTIDGGSRGVFTLAQDSSLNDKLATFPLLESVGDMAIGLSLDSIFNNASPFGCQAGGGNICAATGLKVVTIASGGTLSFVPGTVNATVFPLKTEFGVENLASWAPHPNPPPLTFPPLCLQPLILGEEPTAFLTTQPPPIGPGLTNLLIPSGQPFGVPAQNIPPQGIVAREQNAFFQGPSPPQPTINACLQYMMRQQIGNFLYVIDRSAGEVVVFNSNRFTVLDRIPLPDPTSLAMSPNMDFLAVTNQGADQVSFIDIDPNSSSLHQVVKTTVVGNGPIGIAWTPDNEDILVCNQADNTLSVISAFTFNVRKVILNQLRSPFEVAITPRQQGFSFARGVYFAYILNGDGSVAIFESGPDGFNGWGNDNTIGTLPFTFDRPKTIQVDPSTLNSSVWIVHENQLDFAGNRTGLLGGAVSNVAIASGVQGQIPLDPGAIVNPQIREIEWGVVASIGSDQLTGIPIDIAFDDQNNATPLTNISNFFSAGPPRSINGKSIVKASGGGFQIAKLPQFMFLAVPNSFEGPGVIDVINLDSGFRRFDTNVFVPGVQSIPATNAQVVVDYFRQ